MVRNLSRAVRVDMQVWLVMNLLSLRMWKVLVRLEEGSPRLTVPAVFHYPHTDHEHRCFSMTRNDKQLDWIDRQDLPKNKQRLAKTFSGTFHMTDSKVLTGILTKCG